MVPTVTYWPLKYTPEIEGFCCYLVLNSLLSSLSRSASIGIETMRGVASFAGHWLPAAIWHLHCIQAGTVCMFGVPAGLMQHVQGLYGMYGASH